MMGLSAALPLALFGWIAWSERGRAMAEAERTAVRTVWALHEHAAKVFETHELVLAEVARQVEGRSWEELEADERLWAYVSRVVAELDQITAIRLADATGRVRMTTAAFPAPEGPTMAERSFFRFHREGGAGTRFAAAWPEAERSISISRGLADGAAGGFVGVVQVAVPLDYFNNFWRRFTPTSGHVIPLVHSDGEVLARYPTVLQGRERLNLRGPFLSRALAQREGVYVAVSQVDGVERLNAFTRIKDYPLHISFSVDTRAVLAEWRERMGQLGLFSALAAGALLLATALALRQQRAQQAATKRWREVAGRLEAEMASRERAEAAVRRAQTLNALGQLTAGVAHDFNNLLQAVQGAFVLLRRERPPESREVILDSGLQAVERGAKLVRQLMVFARSERLEPCSVDLRALIAGMGDLLEKAAGPGVRIAVEMAQDLGPVMVDPTQAELAVLNLALNARDALEEVGGGTLTISAANLRVGGGADEAADGAFGLVAPGDYVALSVGDTGPGMPPAVAERALEPFFTTKPVGRGTGLGLSMVHAFATQSGGGVRILSAAGRGTTVRLYLPRAGADAAPPPEAAAEAEAGAATAGERAHVLLVDDDALGRLMTATLLREAGHEVMEARDAEEALAMLRQHPRIDVLVTDYSMPGMTGAQLAEAVRADLPVIMITGFAGAMPEDLDRAAAAVLRKPFSGNELDACIRAARRVAASLGKG
jgi:signal transduction histidine kinase